MPSVLILSGLNISAEDELPTIRLPPTDILVTMNASDEADSYYNMNLSDIPSGYDIKNGIYTEWCIQENILMTQGS